MEPLISVVIPVYNPGNYLIACLDSILANTYRNLEILCIDDGSTDHSVEILEHYAGIDKRIKIFRQKNAGVASARNTGISKASGEYISFIDSDDVIHPQFFEILLNGIQQYYADAVFCDYDDILDSEVKDNPIEKPSYQTQNLDEVLGDGKLRSTSCARLYAYDAIKNFRFPDMKAGEDAIFNCSVMCDLIYNRNKVVVKVGNPLYHYVQRNSSLSHSSDFAVKLPFCRLFLKMAIEETNHYLKKVYTILGFKYLLVARYESAIEGADREIKKNFHCELRKAIHLVNRNPGYSLKERIAYNGFYLCPGLYRLYRILRNPSLREWEKAMKQNRNFK